MADVIAAPVAAAPAQAPVVAPAPAPVVAPVVVAAPVAVAPVVAAPIVVVAAPDAPVVAAVEVKPVLKEGSRLTDSDVTDISKLVKEQGLNQVQAQAMLDQRELAVDRTFAGIQEGFQQTQKLWQETTMKDPEMGGDAVVFPVNMEHSKLGLKNMVPAEELAEIEKAGFGNYPPFLRMGLRWYNAQMKSPNFIEGQPVSVPATVDKSPKAIAERLYPTAAVK